MSPLLIRPLFQEHFAHGVSLAPPLLFDQTVKETSEEGWLHGRLLRTGEEGLFPDNYVELIYVEVTPIKDVCELC